MKRVSKSPGTNPRNKHGVRFSNQTFKKANVKISIDSVKSANTININYLNLLFHRIDFSSFFD